MACIINDYVTGPNVAWSSQKCVKTIDEILNERCIPKPKIFTPGNLVKFDNLGQIIDSQSRIDDNTQNPFVLWTSTKTDSVINEALSKFVRKTDNFIPNKLLIYDSNGEIKSSDYEVDDSKPPSENNLYSSKKWEDLLANATSYTMPKLTNVKDGILCSTKSDGTLDTSANYTIDDSNSSLQNLWTSEKVKNYFDTNVLSQCKNEINLQNENIEALKTKLETKLDKVDGNPLNLVVFDINNNLKDSGVRFDDKSPASDKILWTSGKISTLLDEANSKCLNCVSVPQSFVAGNIPQFTTEGEIKDSGFTIDDTKFGEKVLWSSEKQQQTWSTISSDLDQRIQQVQNSCNEIKIGKMNRLTNLFPNTILKTDSFGNVISSDFVVDDNLNASPNVIWSSEKLKNLAQFSDNSIKSNNLITYTTDNKLADSGYRIDDNCTSSNCLWTASKIDSLLSCNKFFASGVFQSNFAVDDKQWYILPFTILDSSIQTNSDAIYIPQEGYYYISIQGGIEFSDKCEVQMKFKSGNLSNFTCGAGNFNVTFGSADRYQVGESLIFYIQIKTPNVKAVISPINPLKFFVNKI